MKDHAPASLPTRLWLAVPDWLFRVLGAGFFLTFLVVRLPAYSQGFWRSGAWYTFAGGLELYVPHRVLVDLTYLLIALAFCFRFKPRARAATAREVILPLVAAFWPFLPFVLLAVLERVASPEWADRYQAFMFDPQAWKSWQFLGGSALLVSGILLQIWGYAVLFRSLSIVAEARRLKVTGPYRITRHPIYLGQFLALGGLWLFYARTHIVWIAFYVCFVVLQLWRARVEEAVLERAFGDRYTAWKRRTFWFA
jgi:protein-S-isoprenylcysteine O-methyltransferase Ste14